jgi:3-oxo-5-alpha-steroid 4-dehydrogenase 1
MTPSILSLLADKKKTIRDIMPQRHTLIWFLMNERAFYDILIIAWFLIAVATFVTLLRIPAPYGRYFRRGWGPTISDKLGWVVMEGAALLTFVTFFMFGGTTTITAFVLLCLWCLHYIDRTFIYPFTLRSTSNRIPIIIVSAGLLFSGVNGYLNGRYIFTFSDGYANEWLGDWRFISGLSLFLAGFIINRSADRTLHKLRHYGESSYKIPHQGFYRWISSPNYFGEIITWIGWALATWSLAGLAFAVWTAANLVPRAKAHHAWYRKHFRGYPPKRRALVPWMW